MRQCARLTLSAPIPGDTTIENYRHLLEKHQLTAGILDVINRYLQDKGLSLRQGTIVHATIVHAPVRPRATTANVTLKCTRPEKEISPFLA